MLNNQRIRLMTHMAAYEKGAGRRDISISEYFRGDYLSFQVWKSSLYGILGFAIIVALNVLYDFGTFLTDFYKMDDKGDLIPVDYDAEIANNKELFPDE